MCPTVARSDRSQSVRVPLRVLIAEDSEDDARLVLRGLRDADVRRERRRAQTALLERARLAELTSDVGIALTQGTDLRAMLQLCAEALVRHLDVAFARIWTLDDASGTLELQASAGMYTHINGAHSRVRLGQYEIGAIARERRPHLTNQVVGDPQVHDQEWARREGLVEIGRASCRERG